MCGEGSQSRGELPLLGAAGQPVWRVLLVLPFSSRSVFPSDLYFCTNELIKDDDGPLKTDGELEGELRVQGVLNTDRQLPLEVLLPQANALLRFAPVAHAIRFVHHALQHSLLARIQGSQVDLPGGTELSAVEQVLILQPHVVPNEASAGRGQNTLNKTGAHAVSPPQLVYWKNALHSFIIFCQFNKLLFNIFISTLTK